jgi:hypothetical protein
MLLPNLPAPTRGLPRRLPISGLHDDFEVLCVHQRNMAFPGTFYTGIRCHNQTDPPKSGFRAVSACGRTTHSLNASARDVRCPVTLTIFTCYRTPHDRPLARGAAVISSTSARSRPGGGWLRGGRANRAAAANENTMIRGIRTDPIAWALFQKRLAA